MGFRVGGQEDQAENERDGGWFCPIPGWVDFYSPEYKLGIESDGAQHYEDEGKWRDEIRTQELSKQGIEILRFSDRDILNNAEGVSELIQKKIEKKK